MPINNQKMIQSIYDTLFSGYVQPPDAAQVQGANPDPSRIYLCMEWPGKQISEVDVAGGWSPNNPQGKMSATENFSTLVDTIPSTFPMFTATGKKVSEAYKSIAYAQVTPPEPSPEAKKAYDQADALLWKDAKDFDESGNEVTVKKPHPMYAAYKKAALTYTTTLTTFLNQYLSYDMTKAEDQRKWALLGPGLRAPVDAAYDDWTAAHKARIESALATLAQSSNNQVGIVFKEAQRRLELLKRGSGNPGGEWFASFATPANWFSASAADEWTKATISSEKTVKNERSDYYDLNVGGSARWGLWSGGGGFSKSEAHEHMDETTDKLEVSFSYAKVDIDRPWMNALLFGLQGWKTSAAKKNGYSDGTKKQPDTLFPLLPLSFVAVRNLSIKADWGQKDLDMIEKKMASKASFGWGPFSISGGYSSGSKDKTFKSEFDGRTITNNGLQILAWICAVNPPCPPLSMD